MAFLQHRNHWHINWPLLNLWWKVLVVLTMMAMCELAFFKQYGIKSYFRPHLKLGILDVLMCVPLCGIKVYNMECKTIFDI